jgi:hypothetical protein
MANELAALSNEIAAAVEVAGRNVVAVHARPRFSSSGVFWRPGVIVTAEHTIRREEEITVTLPDGAPRRQRSPAPTPAPIWPSSRSTPLHTRRSAPRPRLPPARWPSASDAPRTPASTPPSALSARAATSGAPGAAGAWTTTSVST